MAISSPAFDDFPLAEHGLEWIHPTAPLAHPLDDGSAVVLHRSIEKTAHGLKQDAVAWRRAIGSLGADWKNLVSDILGPLRFPSHPLSFSRFGILAPWPASLAARILFRTEAARALFAGAAAHSVLPLNQPMSSAIGWVLILAAHSAGWPVARGGSQSIADALVSYLTSLGGKIFPNTTVRSIQELPDADLILCDVTPRQLTQLAGDRLPARFCRKLQSFAYGPGVFKMDWALNDPIPWRAAECALAGTVHLGGTLDEIAAAERAPWEGQLAQRPFVLLAQPTLFDRSRAPAGKHTAWAYCHVPNGSTVDMSNEIEGQIERFAPGFRDRILLRSVMSPAELERHNANLQGGDITGGAQTLGQFFLRPTRSMYRTPNRGLYLCSSSTPPGGGVHGMCGYYAARCALADLGEQGR
jgi:phytoene dehydrogenase-like protein